MKKIRKEMKIEFPLKKAFKKEKRNSSSFETTATTRNNKAGITENRSAPPHKSFRCNMKSSGTGKTTSEVRHRYCIVLTV